MGQILDTGLTSVTGSVSTTISSGTPSAVLIANATKSGVGSTTAATITAGKTGYILGYEISAYGTATASSVSLTANGVTIGALNMAASAAGHQSVSANFPFPYAISIAATQTIVLTNSANMGASTATVWYIEV